MASINKVTLIGNMGDNPEIRQMSNGGNVASFSIATSESWTDKNTGDKVERTEWHRVSVFGDGLVGIIEKHTKKGSRVYLEGKLKTNKWQDQDGKDRYTTEIVLSGYDSKFLMLDNK